MSADTYTKASAATMATLVEGNLILKDLADKAGTCSRVEFLDELRKVGNMGEVLGVAVSYTDYEKIMQAYEAGVSLLPCIERSLWKIAMAHEKVLNTDMDRDDLFQEARMAFVRKICYFNREDIQLSTFVYTVVKREIFRAIVKGNKFSPICSYVLELRTKFNKARHSFNGHASFDEILAFADFSEEDRKLLLRAGVRQFNSSESGASNLDDDAVTDRFTDESISQWKSAKDGVEVDFREALVKVRALLNTKQLAVLDAMLDDGVKGWQVRVARKTGITRQMVGKLKVQVEDMIVRVYRNLTTPTKVVVEDVVDTPVPAPKVVTPVVVQLDDDEEIDPEIEEEVVGITYDTIRFPGVPLILLGHGKQTFAVRHFRAKHILQALKDHGGEAVKDACKAQIAMEPTGTIDPTVPTPKGISFRTYARPRAKNTNVLLVFGEGKSTLSVFAFQSKRVLETLNENGTKRVIKALEKVVQMGEEVKGKK